MPYADGDGGFYEMLLDCLQFIDRTTKGRPTYSPVGFLWRKTVSGLPQLFWYDGVTDHPIGSGSKGRMEGLGATWLSTTTMSIAAGSARSDDDTDDLVLSSASTIDTTMLGVALGTDKKVISGAGALTTSVSLVTVVGVGTTFLTDFYPTSNWATTPRSAGGGQLTGSITFTHMSAAVSGSGSRFLSEVAVGDVIGVDGIRFYQVTAIASDTALTIFALWSGTTTTTAVVIENPTLQVDAQTPQQVTEIFSNTGISLLAVSSAATTTGTAGIGGLAKSTWWHPWLVKGTAGTSVILSTQRTTPYALAGYTTTKRRIPRSALIDASAQLRQIIYTGSGARGRNYWTDQYIVSPANRILSAITSGSRTTVNASSGTTFAAPPTASVALLVGQILAATCAAAGQARLEFYITGTSVVNIYPAFIDAQVPSTGNTPLGTAVGVLEFPWVSSGALDYAIGTSFTAGSAYLDCYGWEESV